MSSTFVVMWFSLTLVQLVLVVVVTSQHQSLRGGLEAEITPEGVQRDLAAKSVKIRGSLAQDCKALCSFYSTITDPVNAAALVNWKPCAGPKQPKSCCAVGAKAWTGVSCQRKRVTSLNLVDIFTGTDGAYPSGTLPKSLSSLFALRSLQIAESGVRGSIPSQLARLALSLAQLDLHGNQLTGIVPPSLGACSRLTYLDLSRNPLDAASSIPSALGQLTNLRLLYLSGAQLVGPLPRSLLQLPRLERLDVSSNALSGKIPLLTGAKQLQWLNLGNNRFTGPVPSSSGTLTHLAFGNFAANSLSGRLPSALCNLFPKPGPDLRFLPQSTAGPPLFGFSCVPSCLDGNALAHVTSPVAGKACLPATKRSPRAKRPSPVKRSKSAKSAKVVSLLAPSLPLLRPCSSSRV